MIKQMFFIFVIGLGIVSCSENVESITTEKVDEKEDNFNISGTIANGNTLPVLILAQASQGSITVAQGMTDEHGKFSIDGNIPGLGLYQLQLGDNPGNVLLMTLVPGDKLVINASIETFASTPKATGTAWAQNMSDYMVEVTAFRDKQAEIARNKSGDPAEMQNEYESLKKRMEEFALDRMDKDPGNPFNIVLTTYAVPSMDFQGWNPQALDVLKKVTNAYTKDFPDSPITQTLATQTYQIEIAYDQYVANNSGTRPAPEIALNNPYGKEIKLSSLRGKYVLIDFWASWCSPCRQESPNVVRLYNKYKDKGFTVYSVSLDNDRQKWIEAIEKDGLIWPNHVSDLLQWNSPMPQLYGFNGIPHTVLVNPEGKIIGTGLRGPALEQKLKELFEK